MRPFRFGLVWSGNMSPVDVARRAESAGYATLLFPDHTGMVAPLPAMASAAAVTSTLRLGTQVINIAFRPLGALAQELAAVDIVSAGRVEVGLGAGYNEQEVRSLGLPFPPAGVRVGDVARALDVLPRLFAGQTVTEAPGPGRLTAFALDPPPPQGAATPFMVGGNGDRLLAIAGGKAGIVQLVGFTPRPDGSTDYRYFSATGLADRIAHVRRAAGDRFSGLELGILVQFAGVTPDPHAFIDSQRRPGGTAELSTADMLAAPFVQLATTVDEVCDRLVRLREEHGVTYISVFDHRSSAFDDVVARLSGT
jgi:probable F420-dependent oxidoreductase